MPEKDRDADIFQPETPGTGEQVRVPGDAAQAVAECFDLGLDARFPDLGPADLLLVCQWTVASETVNIRAGIRCPLMDQESDKHPP